MNKKTIIVIIIICSILLGFAFGYVEGLPDGFNQGRSSYIENPPENCFCIEIAEKEPFILQNKQGILVK